MTRYESMFDIALAVLIGVVLATIFFLGASS
jgi:MFS superfamily sulfate permease-like transporter